MIHAIRKRLHHDVFRLQITMHDPRLMNESQRMPNLRQDLRNPPERHQPLPQQRAQRLPLGILQSQ